MNDIREDIKAFLDGELTPERSVEVQSAIDADPALREELEFMRNLGLEIKRLRPEPAVQGASAAMAAVRRSRRPFWLRLETYVAGAIGLLLIAVFFPVFAQSKEAARRSMSESMASAGDSAATPSRGQAGKDKVFSDLPQDGFANGGAGRAPAEAEVPKTEAPPSPAPTTMRQLLIRTATLTVLVPKAEDALAASIRIATSHGGYSSGDNLSIHEGDLPVATVSLRVPVRSFEEVRAQILKLGTMIENNSNTDDVTAQVADVEARLKVMRAEEDSYVTMLRAARKVGELLEIKERLSSVRQEIESLDAQRKVLRDQAAYSTINATFTQKEKIGDPAPPKDWTEDSWTSAINGLKSVGRFLGQSVIYLFVYAPIWAPLVLIGWWLSRRANRN